MPPTYPWPIRAYQWTIAALVAGLFALFRLIPPNWASATGGFVARSIGPLIPRSRIARRNIKMAFPEKSDAEVEEILRGSWDNLGRTACEYPHLDRLWDYEIDRAPGLGRFDVEHQEIFLRLRDSQKPVILFTAHLANWEMLAVCAAHYHARLAVFFRQPNNAYINKLIGKIRGETMGVLLPTDMGGAIAASRALEKGINIGLLADQHFSRGPAIPFFGHPAHTAPTLAKLALRFDCDIHGAHVVRLPKGRFRISITEALPRPEGGTRETRINAILTEVNRTIEGWVRAQPEQWLWQHRRWR